MAQRSGCHQGAKHAAIVLIRGVLKTSTLDELPGERLVCRATVTVGEATLDVMAFGPKAKDVSNILPGTLVALVGRLRVIRNTRPDQRVSQELDVEITRVKTLERPVNNRIFDGRQATE